MSDDAELAARLAEGAGRILLDLREAGGEGKALGRQGDEAANAYLLDELASARPDDAVLSEESADHESRLGADRVWIIDPLDGTREFGMAGRTDWAVHVALWERGREITAAAVALPGLDTVYRSDQAAPAGEGQAPPRIVVSESRPPAFLPALAEELSAQVVPMGSAGAKAMAVLRGAADVYVHGGGQWEWDSAAPAGVALAAGLHASRVDGRPLRYNQPRPYLPDLLICRPELAGQILAAIGRVTVP